MEVEITITGKNIVFNEWTLFQATVNGKKYCSVFPCVWSLCPDLLQVIG